MKTKVKTISALIAMALFTLPPDKNVFAGSNSEETRAVILALFEAFNDHDVEALVALYSPDAVTRSPGDIEASVGLEPIRETYAGHFDSIPGVHDAVTNIVVEGAQGSVEFVASWNQPTEGDPDARGTLRIASFITVKNGKIVRDISYFDRVEMTQNMQL